MIACGPSFCSTHRIRPNSAARTAKTSLYPPIFGFHAEIAPLLVVMFPNDIGHYAYAAPRRSTAKRRQFTRQASVPSEFAAMAMLRR